MNLEQQIRDRRKEQGNQMTKMIGGLDNVTIIKGKAAQEGEVRDFGGIKHKKTGGKWVPVTGDKKDGKKEDPKSSSAKKDDKPAAHREGDTGRHDIAQLTHIKQIMDSDPDKAYEIYQQLEPEVQNKVPQEVVNKFVQGSHASKQDAASAVFDNKKEDKKDSAKSKKSTSAKKKEGTAKVNSRGSAAVNAGKEALKDPEKAKAAKKKIDARIKAINKQAGSRALLDEKYELEDILLQFRRQEEIKKVEDESSKKQFKDESAVEDAFFDIKSRIMMDDYGYEDIDDEGYDEEEDSIMGDANAEFKEKYGYDHYEDAIDEIKQNKTKIKKAFETLGL